MDGRTLFHVWYIEIPIEYILLLGLVKKSAIKYAQTNARVPPSSIEASLFKSKIE